MNNSVVSSSLLIWMMLGKYSFSVRHALTLVIYNVLSYNTVTPTIQDINYIDDYTQ